jgi:hypothetical protein
MVTVLRKSLFIKMAFQLFLKFILLLKILGQLCMLTKFANNLVASPPPKKRRDGVSEF